MKTWLITGLLLTGSAFAATFAPVNATYSGLFYETNDFWQQSSGYITVRTTWRGTYSGTLLVGTARYGFSGRFDENGFASRDLLRYRQFPLHLELQVDQEDPDLLFGTVSDGTWTADLVADRATFDGRTSVSPDMGQYTMIIPRNFTVTNSPGGDGYAVINVDRFGRLRIVGALADGTKFSESTMVSKGGQWPVYAPLYRGQGSIYGWMLLNGSADEDLSGDVTWIRPEMPWTWYYPDGFAIIVSSWGSRYVRPPRGTAVLDLPLASIDFNGGNVPWGITNSITIDSNNRVTNLSANGLRLTFSPANGVFSGRVMDPITWDWLPFGGVVLQRFAMGAGYFSDGRLTGEVWLQGQ